MIQPSALVEAARSLIGTPYVHQGHSVHGVDCIGFLFVVAEKAGLKIEEILPETGGVKRPDFSHRRRPDGRGLLYLRHWLTEDVTPGVGKLVFFQFPGAKFPQHFGLLADRTVIHAHKPMRCVVEHGYRASWVTWTHSIWRIPGVDYGE